MPERTTSAPPLSGAGDLDPWRPSGNDVWDRAKAAHLLRRAAFGGTPEEIDAVVALGMDRAVDILLSADRKELQVSGSVILPHGEVLDLGGDLRGHRALWLWEAVHGASPLREKMALFWHDHFSVGPTAFYELMAPHVNLFRRHGLGNLRDLLIEVTRDPAMLHFLQNAVNGLIVDDARTINENYARELLELYTMGVDGGYTQRDVVEAAKCLSGWSLNDPYPGTRFEYKPIQHVGGPKVVLGRAIVNGSLGREGIKDAFDLIDVILGWPRTAEHVVAKLWRYVVSPDAPAALVTELAGRWRRDGYRLRPLLSTLLRSRFFYGPRAMRALVKNPFEFVVGAIRNTGVTPVGRYAELGDRVLLMGLPLLSYPDPFGTPDGLAWMSSQALLVRMNFAVELGWTSSRDGLEARFDPAREILRKGLRTAEEVVDHFLDYLVDGDVPAAVRDRCVEFMHRDDDRRVPFRIVPTRVDRKVRGLIHVLMALPQYQVN